MGNNLTLSKIPDFSDFLGEEGYKSGIEFQNNLRKTNGYPRWEYLEFPQALAGTEKSINNVASLTELGENGWEMMFVAKTSDPEIVHIIYKRQKFPDFD